MKTCQLVVTYTDGSQESFRFPTQLAPLKMSHLPPSRRDGDRSPSCPLTRQMLCTEEEVAGICRACLQQRRPRTAYSDKRVSRFFDHSGATNLGNGIKFAILCLLTLALQARIATVHFRPKKPDRLGREVAAARAMPGRITARNCRTAETALLERITHDLEATARTRMTEAGLPKAPQSLGCRGIKSAGSRLARNDSESVTPTTTAAAIDHAGMIIQAMLDYVDQHYQRPMALSDVAADLKMNASYLSDLFAKRMNVTFHRYLADLRLAKAKKLLSDPRNRVCEVACAVGYASANHFRDVFKAREGLSPCAWRSAVLPSAR